jgi:hypothetical protein
VIIYLDAADAYHEGGHAAMFWHYGISLEYVSFEPDLINGYGGVTVTAPRAEISGRTALENEMRIAAAGDAAKAHIRHRPNPNAQDLMGRFDATVAEFQADPNPLQQGDLQTFVHMALARDDEFRLAGLDLKTGPSSWVSVWLEAEEMVRGNLWPAVTAVAEALIASSDPRRIRGDEAAALMAAAMTAAA